MPLRMALPRSGAAAPSIFADERSSEGRSLPRRGGAAVGRRRQHLSITATNSFTPIAAERIAHLLARVELRERRVRAHGVGARSPLVGLAGGPEAHAMVGEPLPNGSGSGFPFLRGEREHARPAEGSRNPGTSVL